jgi:hypothetical protein
MDIQKIQTPYSTSTTAESRHSPWFIGILIGGGALLLTVVGAYVYHEYTKPEAQINRALQRISNVDPVPIDQAQIDRALGRVSKKKPITIDPKALREAMNKTQK